MWLPISVGELEARIQQSFAEMEGPERRLWELLRITPEKWACPPWGDEGGGFWVVGLIGNWVIWFNDIEDGFNISIYAKNGLIGQYLCNQDELDLCMRQLRGKIENDRNWGAFGPPEPIR